jgi:D-arginine dehydrogenase
MSGFDVIIIGAGIAGASLAAELGYERSVLLLETESAPGYHSTGRSAAFWSECYGGPGVQPLTAASGNFLAQPCPDFASAPLMTPRGAIHIGSECHQNLANKICLDFSDQKISIRQINGSEIFEMIPGVRPEWNIGVYEPDCCDIDVAALHYSYLRQAKRRGVKLLCDARCLRAVNVSGEWLVDTEKGSFSSKTLVNAAGAWADGVAEIAGVKPIGIRPFRRTIVQLSIESKLSPAIPLVIGLDESFYFKSNTDGTLWLSPHDETPSSACDVAPEEIDVAMAVDRFQQVVDWKLGRMEHKWAGLRNFAPDRLPVIGPDPAMPEFFWLAGQGGFGIQTAPATAKLAASLILGSQHGLNRVDAPLYAPQRLR